MDTSPIEENVSDPLTNEGNEDESSHFVYSIANYGADFTVEVLVKKLMNGDIFVPPFQRQFVWNLRESSRFIESLLLGLPVPNIFLAKDIATQKLMVLDGQQRLQSLKFFYEGIFSESKKQFELKGVIERFEGLTYKTLAEQDRRRLDDSPIHAIIVKQEEPSDNQSSIFYIFERINTGGQRLTSQEIRACIYHGEFSELLSELNKVQTWRNIYGPVSAKMKDQELILRFFAFHFNLQKYSRPMKEFLNDFMAENRKLQKYGTETLTSLFHKTVEVAGSLLGEKPFRIGPAINTAIFDSIMYGLSRRVLKGEITEPRKIETEYLQLVQNEDFLKYCTKATADEKSVQERMRIADETFAGIK